MLETWRPIPGADGYEVSDAGRVRSVAVQVARVSVCGKPYVYTMPQKVLSPGVDGGGYYFVFLRGRHTKVHRLVALVFVEGEGPEVNHRDGNKKNNCAHNLEWCDRSHNLRHAYSLGLKVPPTDGPTPRVKVRAVCRQTGAVHEFASIRDAARTLLGDAKRQPPITHCINGKLKQAYGFTWERI